jgi:hypothetical protein
MLKQKQRAEIVEYNIRSRPLDYSKKWAKFADFCRNQKTFEELIEALHATEDEDECREWGLTPSEWKAGISSALGVLAYEYDHPKGK